MGTHRITIGRAAGLAVAVMGAAAHAGPAQAPTHLPASLLPATGAFAFAPATAETPQPGWRQGDSQRATRNSQLVSSQDSAAALHLLRRATYGVRADDLAAVLAMGRDAWLDRQLHPERIQDDGIAARLEPFRTASMSMDTLMFEYAPLPRPARQRADSMADRATMPTDARRAAERERRRGRARILPDLIGARLMRAVHGERQLEEVMTEFWFNHFNVYFGKGLTRYFVADYERSAIRPRVFGNFDEMLLATAQHPAMLFYLDNSTSVVPDSMNPRVKRPRARRRGLNENYARELLELHTLGVDGGYTQRDVVDLARALTGWTFRRPNPRDLEMMAGPEPASVSGAGAAAEEAVAFVFRPATHDPGEKAVLGDTLPAGRGIEDGVEVIRRLARHPSTARHIATKLVERFVSDEADPEFVEELAGVFLETDGDLREVTRVLFTSERFYDARNVGAKVKTPYELVTSALRLTRAAVEAPGALVSTLRGMGNLPYGEPAPTGYPAASEDWVNAGAMLNRMSFGLKLAEGGLRGTRVDLLALAGVERKRDALQPETLRVLLDAVLPGVPRRELEDVIRADLAGRTQDGPRARLVRAAGLAIGSPEFQMR